MNDILRQLNISDSNKNSLLHNLTKVPKEPKSSMPVTVANKKYASEQADLLFLPDDDGYRYLLVVVDIATRLCDAQPLKSKDSGEVKKALQAIFKRKYIHKPSRLEVDDGAEFKGTFKTFFEKLFKIVTKVAGRHRQQSVVESKNYFIGQILNKRMLAEEINNKSTSRSWVDIVPKVVQLINAKFSHPAREVDLSLPIKTNSLNFDLLDVGTKVRTMLDNPRDYVSGSKLHGKFRTGDIRWDKPVKKITQFFLRPGQPPMYQVDDDDRVAYTREQLQIVKDDEILPPSSGQKKWNIQKLIRRFKKGNKIMFRVLWEDGSETDEPRASLLKDIPELVKAFEKK